MLGDKCEGEVVLVDKYISFFGEVDPKRGALKLEDREVDISGKALAIRGTRGSTVGSYIIYALGKYGKAPSCIIVKEAEPILIAGCALANIPLFIVSDYESFAKSVMERGRCFVKYERESGALALY